jgi:uncharacterized protein (DUF433 family)
MDWAECPIVERVPGKAGGAPVVKGTRILADVIVEEFEAGSSLEEIHENYPKLSGDTIRDLIAFANALRPQPRR